MDYSAQVAAALSKTERALDRTVRNVTLSLFGDIIKGTPRDTGRASGNWQTSVSEAATGVLERDDDQNRTESTLELIQNTPEKAGGKTYMTNNLPYIRRLEEGWSDQSAPGAMVRANFQRVQEIVENEARKNRV